MRVSEAAEVSGLSVDTIRFYEKEGLLPSVARDQAGRRTFSAQDVEWLTLLYWLRETGMPLEQMRHFTELAKAGDATIPERKSIFIRHTKELQRRKAAIERCEVVLAAKIAFYDRKRKGWKL
ncbi:MAG: MerR family transcriptional regulator [Pseudomonadota bacterium]